MKRKVVLHSTAAAVLGAGLVFTGSIGPTAYPSPLSAAVAYAEEAESFPLEEAEKVRDYYNEGRDEDAKLTLEDVTDLIKVYNGALDLNSALNKEIVSSTWFKSTLTAHRTGIANESNRSQRHNITRDRIQRIKGGLGNAAVYNLKSKLDEIKATIPADSKYDGIRAEIDSFKDTLDPNSILNADVLDTVLHNVQDNFTPEKIQEKINEASNPAVDKQSALNVIDQAANEKKQAIADSSMTEEEKATATAEVDKAVENAKKAINEAASQEDAENAKTDGTQAIEAVSTDSTVKQDAIAEIDKAVSDKNAAIDSSQLTDTEKTAAKDEVKKAADEAKAAIDQADTNQAVSEAKNKGVENINNVSTESTAKQAALEAIDQAADAKKQAIADSSMTEEEKAAATTEVDKAIENAKKAITEADTDETITEAQAAGIEAINKVSTEPKVNSGDGAIDTHQDKRKNGKAHPRGVKTLPKTGVASGTALAAPLLFLSGLAAVLAGLLKRKEGR